MKLHDLRENYVNTPFTEAQAGSDPVKLFKEWFEEVKSTDQVEPNAFCLSTIDQKGFPDGRIVLLKEVSEEGFVFYTNFGSKKGKSLLVNPKVTMTFWWSSLHRQVRIRGEARKIDDEHARNYFSGRPKGSQIGALASDQSRPLENRKVMELKFERLSKQYADKQSVPKPEEWGGLEIVPSYFEFWQGQESRMHDRICFELNDGDWVRFRLWP